MPKHKHRHRYCSVRRSGKRDSRNSSRDPVYLTDLDASLIEVNSRASCGDSPAPSSQRDELTSALREILFFMKEYTTPRIPEIDALGHIQDVVPEDIVPGNIVAKDMVTGHVMAEDTDPSLLGELQISHTEVNGQADRQTVLQNRGGEPVCFDPEVIIASSLDIDKENDASLINELFGEHPVSNESPWDSTVFKFTKGEVRSSLKEELRTNLLSKFEIKGSLADIAPPKLNNEIR
ncbi:uncharacterized protein LOC120359212 isoform X1 [Solenopsis invicta]|uniref:uncharacterized protein LOC120359212 isoform X1 n=1 Tax=Solenopsis invicta TaxID=13686 RepID=UPI00193D7199|nr:uncharacterized protein LOC120359212 isoform X1 [Solenopsis invicta]